MSPGAGLLNCAAATRVDSARARARQNALALAESESLAQPVTAHCLWPVQSAHGARLDLGERSLDVPGYADYSGEIASVVAGACSLGPHFEQRVASLFHAQRRLLAFELDALGTEWLFALADLLVARIRRQARRAGLRAGAELNPGDEGLALGAQRKVLALAGAGAHGITVTPGGMLSPVKSLTFVIALGRALPESSAARCDRCGARDRCRIRPT
jgi:hypothetical protein